MAGGDTVEGKKACSAGINSFRALSTHPGQKGLLLSHVVDEAQWPGGAVQPGVQAVVQVRQALSLLLSAVGGLQLGAAVREESGGLGQSRALLAGPSPLCLGS